MIPPNYGSKIQHAYKNNGELLNGKSTQKIQKCIGKFLYYGRGIDITMQHAIKNIEATAVNGTTTTEKAIQHFLDYAYFNLDAELVF